MSSSPSPPTSRPTKYVEFVNGDRDTDVQIGPKGTELLVSDASWRRAEGEKAFHLAEPAPFAFAIGEQESQELLQIVRETAQGEHDGVRACRNYVGENVEKPEWGGVRLKRNDTGRWYLLHAGCAVESNSTLGQLLQRRCPRTHHILKVLMSLKDEQGKHLVRSASINGTNY